MEFKAVVVSHVEKKRVGEDTEYKVKFRSRDPKISLEITELYPHVFEMFPLNETVIFRTVEDPQQKLEIKH